MKSSLSVLLLIVTVAVSSLAQSGAGAPPANANAAQSPAPSRPETTLPSEATLNAFFHRMFGVDPGLAFKVISVKPSPVAGLAEVITLVGTPGGQQTMRFFVSADQQHVIVGDLRPFGADPFAANRALLAKQAFGPTKGSAQPAILLVEFADLQCPACRSVQPVIEKLLADEPGVRLIFQNYPLTQVHPWALEAAGYLDCLARESNEQAWKFIASVYEQQAAVNQQDQASAAARTAKLTQLATAAGADQGRLAACAASPETRSRLERSRGLGDEVDVRATPTLFINGRALSNLGTLPYETLKRLVDFEIAQGK